MILNMSEIKAIYQITSDIQKKNTNIKVEWEIKDDKIYLNMNNGKFLRRIDLLQIKQH